MVGHPSTRRTVATLAADAVLLGEMRVMVGLVVGGVYVAIQAQAVINCRIGALEVGADCA